MREGALSEKMCTTLVSCEWWQSTWNEEHSMNA